MGFEPTRAEHIGLAVQRLNHSATSSVVTPQLNLARSCFTITAQILARSLANFYRQ